MMLMEHRYKSQVNDIHVYKQLSLRNSEGYCHGGVKRKETKLSVKWNDTNPFIYKTLKCTCAKYRCAYFITTLFLSFLHHHSNIPLNFSKIIVYCLVQDNNLQWICLYTWERTDQAEVERREGPKDPYYMDWNPTCNEVSLLPRSHPTRRNKGFCQAFVALVP